MRQDVVASLLARAVAGDDDDDAWQVLSDALVDQGWRPLPLPIPLEPDDHDVLGDELGLPEGILRALLDAVPWTASDLRALSLDWARAALPHCESKHPDESALRSGLDVQERFLAGTASPAEVREAREAVGAVLDRVDSDASVGVIYNALEANPEFVVQNLRWQCHWMAASDVLVAEMIAGLARHLIRRLEATR